MMHKLASFFLAIVLLTPLGYASSFSFKGSNDEMGINEEMGSALEALTASHLTELKGGELKTKEGTTKYNQYIRFQDTSTAINSSIVTLKKSSNNEVEEFLIVNKGTAVTDAFFEYHLEFEEGLKSKLSETALGGLEGVKLKIFDQDYIIVDATVDGSRIILTLASGAIADFLKKDEKKEYIIGEKKYEVTVKTIETATKAAVFNINGKDLRKLVKTETEDLGDGVILGITDVLISQADSDIVQFFIGANILNLEDNSYQDKAFNKGVKINKNKIEDAFIKISASLVNDIFKISDIKYRLITKDTIYAKVGEGILKYIKNPEAMLTNWDIKFEQLTSPSQIPIKLVPSGSDDEYTLSFTNPDGQLISVPFLSNKGSFKFGDNDQDLVVVEGASSTTFNIDKDDYFVLTTANTKTGKTYIAKYDSIDTAANTIHFTQLGVGAKSVQYGNSSVVGALGEADLTIGSITAKVFVNNNTGNSSLAIDLDGDASFDGDAVDIIVKGGGILDPGATNNPSLNYALTLTTVSSQFEEASGDEIITMTFEDPAGNVKLGIQSTLGGVSTGNTAGSVLGLSNYGAKLTLLNPSEEAETLTIGYPLKQVFASLTINVGAGAAAPKTSVKDIKVTTCSNGKQDGDETGVDCGGSCPACPSCSDGEQNQGEEGIDCGGPCVNKCEPKEKDKGACSQGCLQILAGEQSVCLAIGDRVKNLYCATDQSLKLQKRNRATCQEAYECKANACNGGKCGKKISVVKIAVNVVIILIILGILIYAFSLFKSPPQDL